MLKKSENHDINYLATVVELDNLKDHPNADKLEIFEIYGGNVIVAKGLYPIGEKVVYFPLDSKISVEFLSWANLLDKAELNADGKTKGFFGSQFRVKPIRLRQIPSEGFVYPVSKIAEFFGVDEKVFKVGESFDMVGDKVLLEKWVSGAVKRESAPKKPLPKWVQIMPRPIRKFLGARFFNRKDAGFSQRIVQGQFHFHYSTPALGKMVFCIDPEDEITISSKFHGTSNVNSRILCYRERKWWEKLFNVSNGKLDKEYHNVYSSRSIIKNRKDGTYTDDVWGKHAKEIFERNILPEGVSIFSEIVGYVNQGKQIQKSYDYGHKPGESGLYVYRMTSVDPAGNVTEWSFKDIIKFCRRNDLMYVPVYYQGIVKDLFPEIPVDDDWRKNFLKALSDKYLEKDCEFCKTKVPAEGIVVRNESKDKKPAFKFKSFAFSLRESGDRDKGETNIEEES